jgi:hypothetical protein
MSVGINPGAPILPGERPALGSLEGEEGVADGASLPNSVRLQKRPATLVGAGGANVMSWLTPVIVRLESKYQGARTRGEQGPAGRATRRA